MREKPVGFVDNEPTQVLQRETATCPQVLNQPPRCSHEDIHRAPPAATTVAGGRSAERGAGDMPHGSFMCGWGQEPQDGTGGDKKIKIKKTSKNV